METTGCRGGSILNCSKAPKTPLQQPSQQTALKIHYSPKSCSKGGYFKTRGKSFLSTRSRCQIDVVDKVNNQAPKHVQGYCILPQTLYDEYNRFLNATFPHDGTVYYSNHCFDHNSPNGIAPHKKNNENFKTSQIQLVEKKNEDRSTTKME